MNIPKYIRVTNYHDLYGYVGNDKWECVDLKGKRYLIKENDSDALPLRVINDDGEKTRVLAVVDKTKGLISKLRREHSAKVTRDLKSIGLEEDTEIN